MIQQSLEDILHEAANMLKQHMETATPELPIQLDDIQYQDILRKVFLDSKLPQVQQETSTTNPATTLGEAADRIKEILNNHKITLETSYGSCFPDDHIFLTRRITTQRRLRPTVLLLLSKKPWRRFRRYRGR